MKNKSSTQLAAKHVLIECYGKQSQMDGTQLLALMKQAALATGATILYDYMHAFGEGSGFTGALILAESHITVHTWPEHNYAAFDIFVCGECDPMLGANLIAEYDLEAVIDVRMVDRGDKAHNLAA